MTATTLTPTSTSPTSVDEDWVELLNPFRFCDPIWAYLLDDPLREDQLKLKLKADPEQEKKEQIKEKLQQQLAQPATEIPKNGEQSGNTNVRVEQESEKNINSKADTKEDGAVAPAQDCGLVNRSMNSTQIRQANVRPSSGSFEDEINRSETWLSIDDRPSADQQEKKQ